MRLSNEDDLREDLELAVMELQDRYGGCATRFRDRLKREAVAADAPCAPGSGSRPGATALLSLLAWERVVPNVTRARGRS
jgi:hypothetical protein